MEVTSLKGPASHDRHEINPSVPFAQTSVGLVPPAYGQTPIAIPSDELKTQREVHIGGEFGHVMIEDANPQAGCYGQAGWTVEERNAVLSRYPVDPTGRGLGVYPNATFAALGFDHGTVKIRDVRVIRV